MAVTVASMQAVLTLDKSQFSSGMAWVNSNVNNFSNKVIPGLKSAALLGAGAIAGLGAGVVTAGTYLIGLGSDAEEMQGKFNTVFGEVSSITENELTLLSDQLGRNRFDMMGWASALQDTFVPLGFTRKEAAGLSVDLTQLTVDMASFNNTTEQQALDDLQSAIVGNHETMRKYGVIITQATLEQELLNMGLAGGIKEATEQQKVMARLNIIMAGTTDAQGDALRTSGSWANQMRALKAELSETATTMGMELLPVVTPFLKDVLTLAKQYLPDLISIFSKFAKELGATVGPAITIINDALEKAGFETDAAGLALSALEGVLGTVITAIKLGSMAFAGWILMAGEIRKAWRFVVNIFDDVYWAIEDMARAIKKLPNSLPEYLQMHSPPPLADAFSMVKEAAMGMPDFNKTLAMPPAYKFPQSNASNVTQNITQNNNYQNGESGNLSYYQLRSLAA